MTHQKTSFVSVSLGFFLILASNTSAETAQKAAWQLTPEERAAARQAEIARQRTIPDGRVADRPVRISGADRPELFLPIELFRRLMLITFSSNSADRDFVRRRILERAAAGGIALPGDFWLRLESVSSDYLASNRRVEQISRNIHSPSVERERTTSLKTLRLLKASQCELRETALGNARTEFGTPWFDRFLYETVAPTTHLIINGHEPADPAVLMRDAQGECL